MVSKMIILFVAVTCWTAQSNAAAVTDVSDAESAWAEHKVFVYTKYFLSMNLCFYSFLFFYKGKTRTVLQPR